LRRCVTRPADERASTTKDTKVHEGNPLLPSCTFVSFVVIGFEC
jgi:hypothetical protein